MKTTIEKKDFKNTFSASLGLLSLCLLAGCGLGTLPSSSRLDSDNMHHALEGSPLERFPSEESSPEESDQETSSQNSEQKDMTQSESMDLREERPSPVPGLRTLENFITTAMEPVGNTMYTWGGGWNEEDTGAGIEARSIGLSPLWKEFADKQTSKYNYKDTLYQIHDGLDCSGFVGWAIYNTMETKDGQDGYVMKSSDMAKTFASYGWGDFLAAGTVKEWLPGDVCSMNGHVWISLGTCKDGSVLLVHSSPPGVRICGTSSNGETSEAVELARQFMSANYPSWHERYPDCSVDANYLQKSGLLRWNDNTFPDAEKIRSLTPAEILAKYNQKENAHE